MTALNFNPSFVPDIESGRICRTIRRVRRAGNPQPGEPLQLFTGLRTSKCKKIMDVICTSVRPVEIYRYGFILDGHECYPGYGLTFQLEDRDGDFARADGFESFSDMVDFFGKQYGLPFKGQLIEWDYEQ